MKRNNLLILAITALILVALAFAKSFKNNAQKTMRLIGKTVIDNLPVNNITGIEISDEKQTLQIQKKNEQWCVPSKFDYPIDFGKIRDLLLKISEMKVGQVVTISEKQRETLRLIKPSVGVTNCGTFVRFLDHNNKELASLLVGESRKKQPEGSDNIFFGGFPDGLYVSPDEGKTVYLVNEQLYGLSTNPKEWYDAELLNVPSPDISEITIIHPDKSPIFLKQKEGSDKLVLADLSKKEEMDDSKVSSVQAALSFLRMDDVANPALSDEETGLDKPVIFEAKTKKGEIYRVKIGKVNAESNYYVRIAMDLTPAAGMPPPPPPTPTNQNQNATNEQNKAEQKSERASLEEKMTALNNKLGKWTFLMAHYKINPMIYQRENFIAPKKTEKKENEAPKKVEEKKSSEEKKANVDKQQSSETKKKKGFFPFWKK